MDYQSYLGIVIAAAIIFSLASRFLQERLMDRKLILEVQTSSKEISDELKKAKERNDKKKIDDLNQKQLELLPKMQKMMFGQLKLFVVVIGLFLAFSWAINYFDPTIKDDSIMYLKDDGLRCDKSIDGTFSGCFENTTNLGEWSAKIQAFNGEQQVAESTVHFLVGSQGEVPNPTGTLNASTDKRIYQVNEQVILFAKPDKATSVKATLDNGTSVYLDLPFVLPLWNTARIRTASGVFISTAFVFGLLVSFIIGAIKRVSKKEGKT